MLGPPRPYLLRPGRLPHPRWRVSGARPLPGFRAERIIPADGFAGNHIFLTDGDIAFDYHGYSTRSHLLRYHRKDWSRLHDGWDCAIEIVAFDLLDTRELNRRKMLGPDQYAHDPIPRARRFIERIDHSAAAAKAAAILS